MKFYTITLATLAILAFASTAVRAESQVTVRLVIEQEVVLIDLLDNPAAKAFAAQLPLTLPFKDYAGEEKIAKLPHPLRSNGSPSANEVTREAPIDFTYFVPWGNLAVFYNGFGDNSQLLALGRIRTGKALLVKQRNDFTATLERVEP